MHNCSTPAKMEGDKWIASPKLPLSTGGRQRQKAATAAGAAVAESGCFVGGVGNVGGVGGVGGGGNIAEGCRSGPEDE